MKRALLFFFVIFYLNSILISAHNPDFIVSRILIGNNNFIYIELKNRSTQNCKITPELNEKIFLTIYINNIKRAEYKLKYINKKLFEKNSTILFRTNFRLKNQLNIKVEINIKRIIPESNFLNNILNKQLHLNE